MLRPASTGPPGALALGQWFWHTCGVIEVTLLGTGSPIPDPLRAGPSMLVRASGQIFLVDCGRGVLQRAAAVGVGADALTC